MALVLTSLYPEVLSTFTGTVAGLGLSAGTAVSSFLEGKKRVRGFEFDFGESKKAKLELIGQSMPRARRSKYGRRGRKRRFRRRRRVRYSLAKRVKRIIFKHNEPKRTVVNELGDSNLVPGDLSTRIVTVYGITQFLTQGVQDDQFIGNQVRLRGLAVRGQIECQQATGFQNFYVVLTLIKTRQTSVVTQNTGNTYGNTTTASANPAQTAPHSNLHLFQDSAALQFVGSGFQTPFDTSNLKILGQKVLNINSGGGENSIQGFKFYWNLRNMLFTFQDPVHGDLSAGPNHGKYGSIFLIRQVIAGANLDDAAQNTSLGEMDAEMRLFFRDP